MMKKIFWILLAANAIFFAAMQWGGLLTAEPEAPVSPVLHEEKIRLLDAPQTPAQPVPAAASAVPAAVSAPAADARACMEWGEFSGAELARATAALNALRPGIRLGQREVEYNIGYWVYIPPLKDKAAVAQKIEQLKARGVEEYFVVQEAGVWLNAISLGVFKTREAAQNFVNQLRAMDVRSAQVGERSSKLKATVFVLNSLDAATAEKLSTLQKDFPDSELRQVSCMH
ncbi:MAG TPA: SPOR domain-containing protein [Gallionella sp.]|nr:SPOR domain-containing protein [Gallionella sp.]